MLAYERPPIEVRSTALVIGQRLRLMLECRECGLERDTDYQLTAPTYTEPRFEDQSRGGLCTREDPFYHPLRDLKIPETAPPTGKANTTIWLYSVRQVCDVIRSWEGLDDLNCLYKRSNILERKDIGLNCSDIWCQKNHVPIFQYCLGSEMAESLYVLLSSPSQA